MIEGTLDRTVGSTLNGWAWDSSRPRERLVVDLYDHDERQVTLTSGRANYSMEFAYYEALPNSLAEEIMAKNKGPVR